MRLHSFGSALALASETLLQRLFLKTSFFPQPSQTEMMRSFRIKHILAIFGPLRGSSPVYGASAELLASLRRASGARGSSPGEHPALPLCTTPVWFDPTPTSLWVFFYGITPERPVRKASWESERARGDEEESEEDEPSDQEEFQEINCQKHNPD